MQNTYDCAPEIFNKALELTTDIQGNPDNDASLKDDLGLDSLALVALIVNIEDVMGIQLDDSDLSPEDLLTVRDVLELIERYCD